MEQYFSNPVVANFLAGGTAGDDHSVSLLFMTIHISLPHHACFHLFHLGVIQWLPPIYCFDVIKSRMQCAPRGHYSGVLDCASKLLREEGWRVFFR